jgi:hypothetical protein
MQSFSKYLKRYFVLANDLEQFPAPMFEGITAVAGIAEISEELSSDLISCYERALQRGIHPRQALAVILSWAAEETARLYNEERSSKASG